MKIAPPPSIVPPPSIAITLAINPPIFKRGDHDVEMSVTAVSDASYPITIFTWPNVLNPGLAQQRGNLRGFDRDTAEPLKMRTLFIKRMPYSFVLGGEDDEFFFTLEPGQPMKFNASFGLADDVGNYFGQAVLPGHRCLIDVQPGEQVEWWKKGRKEDVLNLPGQDRGAYHADGKPIALNIDEPIEFKVLPLDD
jgi:hypothetical protein